MAQTYVEINKSGELQKYFGDLFDKTNREIKHAMFDGIATTIDAIKTRTLNNIAGSDFKSSTSNKFGVGLIEGVRAFMVKGEGGIVHVLGNMKSNDGTWRLRFFEGGATRKNRGIIGPRYFFKHAISGADAEAMSNITARIQQAINDINK